MADDLAGLEVVRKPVGAVMIHQCVGLRLGQEQVDILVECVGLRVIDEVQEVLFQLRFKGGNEDETVVGEIHIVPVMVLIVVVLRHAVYFAGLGLELGHINGPIRLLHLGEEVVGMLGDDLFVDEMHHLVVDANELLLVVVGTVFQPAFFKLFTLLSPFVGQLLGLGGLALELQHLLVFGGVFGVEIVHIAGGVQVVLEKLVVVDDEVEI